MQDVQPLLQERREIFHEFIRIDLGGLGGGAVYHGGIELIQGHGLAQIVRVGLAVQIIMEAGVVDIP